MAPRTLRFLSLMIVPLLCNASVLEIKLSIRTLLKIIIKLSNAMFHLEASKSQLFMYKQTSGLQKSRPLIGSQLSQLLGYDFISHRLRK